MEQDDARTQHPERNVVQMLEANVALPLPADDELRAAVDLIMDDGNMQNQKQGQDKS